MDPGLALDEDAEFVHRTDKVSLIKVFRTGEETFIDAVKEQRHLLEKRAGLGHHGMVQERLDAIRSCGYLSLAVHVSVPLLGGSFE